MQRFLAEQGLDDDEQLYGQGEKGAEAPPGQASPQQPPVEEEDSDEVRRAKERGVDRLTRSFRGTGHPIRAIAGALGRGDHHGRARTKAGTCRPGT